MSKLNFDNVPRFTNLGSKIIVDSYVEYDIEYTDIHSVVDALNQQEQIIREQNKELEELRQKDSIVMKFFEDIIRGIQNAKTEKV